jgi:hypothetical protein
MRLRAVLSDVQRPVTSSAPLRPARARVWGSRSRPTHQRPCSAAPRRSPGSSSDTPGSGTQEVQPGKGVWDVISTPPSVPQLVQETGEGAGEQAAVGAAGAAAGAAAGGGSGASSAPPLTRAASAAVDLWRAITDRLAGANDQSLVGRILYQYYLWRQDTLSDLLLIVGANLTLLVGAPPGLRRLERGGTATAEGPGRRLHTSHAWQGNMHPLAWHCATPPWTPTSANAEGSSPHPPTRPPAAPAERHGLPAAPSVLHGRRAACRRHQRSRGTGRGQHADAPASWLGGGLVCGVSDAGDIVWGGISGCRGAGRPAGGVDGRVGRHAVH